MAFFRGQKVVCVKEYGRSPTDTYGSPVVGEVYTVAAVVECPGYAEKHLELVEVYSPETFWEWAGFRESMFRPVKTTDISALTALLNPTPDEARKVMEEDVDASLETVSPWLAEIARLQEENSRGD